jgi:hypothetical protein
MSEEKLNRKFEIPVEKLEEELDLSLNGNLSSYKTVVSPRDLYEVTEMTFMKEALLERLVRKIPLRGDPSVYPYQAAEIRVFGREPKGCDVGQTFVSKSKILDIMANLQTKLFSGFVAKGLSKMPPAIIYGRDIRGQKVIAFYLPPFIEVHGNTAVLIDGMHRNMICHSAGTTTNAIHISRLDVPLPFDPIYWSNVKMVDEKPPVEQRYRGLKKEYFRDLGAVGIDG